MTWEEIQQNKEAALEKYRLLCLRSFVAARGKESAQTDIATAQPERLPELQTLYEDRQREDAQANADVHAFFRVFKQAIVQATDYESFLLLTQKTGLPAEIAVRALGLSAADPMKHGEAANTPTFSAHVEGALEIERQAAERLAQNMQDVIRTAAKCRAIRALMAHDARSAEQAAALVTTSEEEARALLAKLAE